MRRNSALLFALLCVFHLCSAQGPGLEPAVSAEEEPIPLQTQLFIVTGILGGMILLLIILVLALALSLVRLRKNVYSRQNRYAAGNNSGDGAGVNNQNVAQISAHGEREHIHAYDNNAFGGGGGNSHEMQERRVDAAKDLERMGYSVYNGRNHENRITGAQRDSRQTLMRYEDGVVPIVEATNNNHSSAYRNNNRY